VATPTIFFTQTVLLFREASLDSRVAPANRGTQRYDPAIDGVRGVAIALVLLFHLKEHNFSGGFLGVDLFFGLSGYLITTLLLDEWQNHRRIRLSLFYARRALRLLPAVLALLAVLWLAVLGAQGSFATSPALMTSTTLYTLGYTANWLMALKLGSWPTPLDHLWSLAIEEQFYLFWPFLLVLILRARWRPSRIIAFLIGGAMLVACWRAALWWWNHDYSRVYYATDTRVDGLLLGCAMAIALHYRLLHERRLRLVGVLGSFAFVASSLVLINTNGSPYLGGLAVVNASVAVMIGALVCSPRAAVRSALEFRPLVWVGRISYGLYLWHFPVYFAVERVVSRYPLLGGWLRGVLQVALAVALAAVSYYLLERPALRLKRRFYPSAHPQPAPALAPVAERGY